ncbi:MAG: GspE/PulE family protein [Patescibacteria group bacterium]|nr:GspE/PulE family protein [Patescibacteria group bacterium]
MTHNQSGYNIEEQLQNINRQFKEQSIHDTSADSGYKYVDIAKTPIDADTVAVTDHMVAEKGRIIPFLIKGTKIKVAIVDPENTIAKKEVARLAEMGFEVKIYICSPEGFQEALNTNMDRYEAIDHFKVQQKEIEENEHVVIEEEMTDVKEIANSFRTKSAGEILATILATAIGMNASDIHVETYEKQTRVRFRIDGNLHDVVHIDNEYSEYLKKEIKFKSKMKLNITNVPQDGRFFITIADRKVDLRISLLPSQYGESFVARILDASKNNLTINDLGFPVDIAAMVKRNINKKQGLVLVTGPTGSGKTTTLYALLQSMNSMERKIITLEDPIEYELPGIEQSEIDQSAGYMFADGLRAILRHDPDVVLVGEIRDKETAETTANAALTGHTVFSTIHTNSAVGAFARLMHIGVPSYMLQPSVNLILAQRLVRKLCPECKEEHVLEE